VRPGAAGSNGSLLVVTDQPDAAPRATMNWAAVLSSTCTGPGDIRSASAPTC